MLKNRNIPFGYCVLNGKYSVNKNEAKAVQKIFTEYIGGKSLKVIAAEMQIPYNTTKTAWNKNMVCRIIENSKYTGENGYPKIISEDEFTQAAEIKSIRKTYRKPNVQAVPQKFETKIYEYIPTDEIQRITNEINQPKDVGKKEIEALITHCAQLKYSAINEVRK